MNRTDPRTRWEAAYRACDYVVLLPAGELALRPGVADEHCDRRLVAEAGVSSQWALITPCNPGSRLLEDADNLARLGELRAALAAAGCRGLRSVNRDPGGHWPDEPGLLVCDPPPGRARALAARFGQNAYLAGVIGAAPELVWLAGQTLLA